jgi:hypothetical protein
VTVFIDTSVALAHLLVEARRPSDALWAGRVVGSRLLEYEVWNRLQAYGSLGSYEQAARELLARLDLFELSPIVLARALEPFPLPVRTLDGLHLATLAFSRRRFGPVRFASYDVRQSECARALGFEVLAP